MYNISKRIAWHMVVKFYNTLLATKGAVTLVVNIQVIYLTWVSKCSQKFTNVSDLQPTMLLVDGIHNA